MLLAKRDLNCINYLYVINQNLTFNSGRRIIAKHDYEFYKKANDNLLTGRLVCGIAVTFFREIFSRIMLCY